MLERMIKTKKVKSPRCFWKMYLNMYKKLAPFKNPKGNCGRSGPLNALGFFAPGSSDHQPETGAHIVTAGQL